MSRLVDHIVLPVKSLVTARQRYESLGFNVAKTGSHPFGTQNCCIYFPDGTFIETLAIGDETKYTKAQNNNCFIQNDFTYRKKRAEGFSCLALKSEDAQTDHAQFIKQNISSGNMLEFSRTIDDKQARFKLAFAKNNARNSYNDMAHFFTCQTIEKPQITQFTNHKNTATSFKQIVLMADNPADFQYFLQDILQTRNMIHHSFGIELKLANCLLSVFSPQGMAAFFGNETLDKYMEGHNNEELQFSAFVLACKDIKKMQNLLENNKINYYKHSNRLVIRPACGQGCVIAIEEIIE